MNVWEMCEGVPPPMDGLRIFIKDRDFGIRLWKFVKNENCLFIQDLNDTREVAIVESKVASILAEKGDIKSARSILEYEVIPTLKSLEWRERTSRCSEPMG